MYANDGYAGLHRKSIVNCPTDVIENILVNIIEHMSKVDRCDIDLLASENNRDEYGWVFRAIEGLKTIVEQEISVAEFRVEMYQDHCTPAECRMDIPEPEDFPVGQWLQDIEDPFYSNETSKVDPGFEE